VLKFIFWSLLVINALLFAYGRGYLGHFSGNEHEPQRLRAQLNPGRLVLVSSARAEAAASAVVPAAAAPSTPAAPAAPEAASAAAVAAPRPLAACTEIGNFSAAEAKRFEGQFAALDIGAHETRLAVPTSEVTQHVVYIPNPGSKEALERKEAELKDAGITSFYVIPENLPLRGGISLGVFKSDAAAQTLLAAVIKQGVHGARVADRGPTVNKFAYQFRGIDVDQRAQLDKLRGAYAGIDLRNCK
jgi:hypothetical protein